MHATGTSSSDPRRKALRRGGVLTALLLAPGLALGSAAASAQAAPETTEQVQATSGRHLLVADTAAEKIYVYQLSDMQLTGQLDDIVLGAHAGTVVLSDGRVLFTDDKTARVVAVEVDAQGHPTIVGEAQIPTQTPWNRAAWAAVDPAENYYVVTSDNEDATRQTATVVDLFDYSVGQVDVELNPNAEGGYDEMHGYLAGQPLQLVVTAGGEFRGYSLAEVMAGTVTGPTSSAPSGPNTHGPVVSRDGDRLYVTTEDGLDSVRIVGGALEDPDRIVYSRNRHVVQNFRPRLSLDGESVYGAIARDRPTPLPAERWADAVNFVHAADLEEERSRVLALDKGIIGRFAISEPLAVFSSIHPSGDEALLFDVDPASPSFRTIVDRVPLAPLTKGPQQGVSADGTERRSTAVTPRGDLAFVSHGGDGLVSVIDTDGGDVVQQVSTPTPLAGGGYLVTVERGAPMVDIVAR